MSSIITKINYAKESAKSLANDILNGNNIILSEKEVQDRRDICDKCEMLGTLGKMKYCKECLCSINVKTAGVSFTCPKDKW